MRSITPSDYEFLYKLETAPELGSRWRFRSGLPSPERFAASLFDGVLASFLVEERENGKPLGFVTAYSADFRNGHCYLAVAATPEVHGRGVLLEAAGLFINYCFQSWDFRKLYAETFDFALASFAGVTRSLFVEEGRLREHEYHLGRYWDKVYLALYRDEWDRQSERLLAYALGHSRIR